MTETLAISRPGPGVVVLQLNRPRQLNAINEIGASDIGAHDGGAKEREEEKGEEFLHDGGVFLSVGRSTRDVAR